MPQSQHTCTRYTRHPPILPRRSLVPPPSTVWHAGGFSSVGRRWRPARCTPPRIARPRQRLKTSRNLQCVAGRATVCFKGCTRRERCVTTPPPHATTALDRPRGHSSSRIPSVAVRPGPMPAHHRALPRISFSIDETRLRTARVSNTRRGGRASATIRWRRTSTRGALIRLRAESRGGASANRSVRNECGLVCLLCRLKDARAPRCAKQRCALTPPPRTPRSNRRVRRSAIIPIQSRVKANDASDSCECRLR